MTTKNLLVNLNICLVLSLACASAAQCEPLVRLENTDSDPEKEVVIENSFYRMVIKPSQGASAVSFKPKPSGTEMLLSDPKYSAGLMSDVIRDQGFGSEWQGPYDVEIRSAGPKEGVVVFQHRAADSGELKRLTLTKTIKVSADSPVIAVNVNIGVSAGEPLQYGLRYWVHNRVGHPEKKTSYFFPTSAGVDDFIFMYDQYADAHQHTVLNPPRFWMAAIVENGPGLGFCISGAVAPERLYSYGKRNISTVEWGYDQVYIKQGESWSVDFSMVPFQSMPRVDGVTSGLVGAIVNDDKPSPGKPLKGKVLLAGEPVECQAEIEWRRLPDTNWQALARQQVQAQAPREIPFELAMPTPGTYVLRVRLGRKDTSLGTFERAFVAGEPSGRYVLLPENLRTDQLGATSREGAIPLKPDTPMLVAKVLPVDCRLVRGFVHAPVDGRTDTRSGDGTVAEWSGIHGLPAASYGEFNGNNGLHITLPEGGFDALIARGGWQGRAYADIDSLTKPGAETPALCEVRSQFGVFRKSFERPATTRRVSFFYNEPIGEPLADVSFLRVAPGKEFKIGDSLTFGIGAPVDPDEAVHRALLNRFGLVYRAYILAQAPGAGAALGKGEFIHFITPPQDPKLGIAAVGFELQIAQVEPNSLLTLRVQDALDPRREWMGVDFLVPGPGKYLVTLDTPDQVFLPPKEEWKAPPRVEPPVAPPPALWISLAADSPMKLDEAKIILHRAPRDKALAEAGAWRKFLLKGLCSNLSEPRPWMHLEDKKPVREQFSTHERMSRYEMTLIELFENAEVARLLMPDDNVVCQYHDWLYQNMDRRKPYPPPVLPDVPGAPEWAVLLRQTWRDVQIIPQWWLENRLVPGGLLGGGINDDTDMFQTWQCLPMIESEPLGTKLRKTAEELSDSAWAQTLEEGINKRTTDALHAYEEGVNQLALCAWWFYGDPIHYERVMISARTSMKLMTETKDGRLHFADIMVGIDQARNGYEKLGASVDGAAYLFLHPLYEAALYNRHPGVLAGFQRWGDTILKYQKTNEFVSSVDIPTGKPVKTAKTFDGAGGGFMALYQITGDAKWLQPMEWSMETKGDWGFYSKYGCLDQALIRWEDPYQEKMRQKFAQTNCGYAGFFLAKDRLLLDKWLKDSASWYGRFRYMHTAAEQKTDRVFTYNAATPISCYLGDAPNRNQWLRNTAVSYENLRGEDFAALVWDAGPDTLRVAIYNFNDKPISGLMRVWRLDHGRYRVKTGPDKDDDGAMDSATEERAMELQRYSPIGLLLPPKQVTIVQVEQVEKLDDIRARADLALSEREVKAKGGKLTGVAHNIGVLPVEDVKVALLDAEGKVLASQSLGKLEAPLDMIPRSKPFELTLPGAPQKGWRVVLDPDNIVPEIYEGNNFVSHDEN